MKEKIYLIDIDEKNKAGLFYSVLDRAFYSPEDFDIYNISFYDSSVVRFVKRLLGFKVREKKSKIIYQNLCVAPLHVPKGVLSYILTLMKFSGFSRYLDARHIVNIKNIGENSVIYAHWGLTAGIIGGYIKDITLCKLLVCYHGSDVHSVPFENKKIGELVLKAMNKSNMNIFVSEALLGSAKELGYRSDNHCVIPNCVRSNYGENITKDEVDNFISSYSIKMDNIQNKKLVGFIGNLKEVKGADFLPSILEDIHRSYPNTSFLIAGDGELSQHLRESSCNDYMIGHIRRKEVELLLSLLDVLIVPSRNEGLPLIIVEAQKCGTNVVASNVGGIGEVLDKRNCIDLDDDFINKFSERVVSILQDNEKPDFFGGYTWEDILKVESEMINEIIYY